MKNFSLDYSALEQKVTKKTYKYSEVKDQLVKVAFDVVRFKGDDKGADLWQVQSADDGEYIVALYQPDEEEKKEASWEVIATAAGNLQFSYKGAPVVKLAAATLGIPNKELHTISEYLPAKLANNKKLVKALLKELPPSSKQELLNKYPELA